MSIRMPLHVIIQEPSIHPDSTHEKLYDTNKMTLKYLCFCCGNQFLSIGAYIFAELNNWGKWEGRYSFMEHEIVNFLA